MGLRVSLGSPLNRSVSLKEYGRTLQAKELALRVKVEEMIAIRPLAPYRERPSSLPAPCDSAPASLHSRKARAARQGRKGNRSGPRDMSPTTDEPRLRSIERHSRAAHPGPVPASN